jgi:hypothetical protein
VTAAARVAVAAVLVLAGSLAMLWAGTGPTGPAGTVRLVVMAAAVAAVVLALSALQPKGDGDHADTP